MVNRLQIHPEFRRRFEKRSQANRGGRRDASFTLQNHRNQ
jgi:hypothetical protein